MNLDEKLNELLTDTFYVILKTEEKALKREGCAQGLSISEIHLIEAIAKSDSESSTVSGLAARKSLTLPTVTVAINKLKDKGYVEKLKCEDDGRSIKIMLTEKGLQVNECHDSFHKRMVRQITEQLADEEKSVFLKTIQKLNKYFSIINK